MLLLLVLAVVVVVVAPKGVGTGLCTADVGNDVGQAPRSNLAPLVQCRSSA